MQELEQKIKNLESQLTGALLYDLDIREEIYHLKRQMQPQIVEGESCSMEDGCLNCGS